MNTSVTQLWKQYGWRLLLDAALLLFFLVSLVILFTLKSSTSTWALIPHGLCNLSLWLLLMRHRSLGRPAMYWSHFDFIVVALFACCIANVYYSEVRAVSWRTAALYLDSFSAYLLGRMLFYHRIRSYVLVLLAALTLSWVGTTMVKREALASATELRQQAQAPASAQPAGGTEALLSKADYQRNVGETMKRTRKTIVLLLCFWVLSVPFLLLEKPRVFAFFFYGIALLAGYGVYAGARLSWMWAFGHDSSTGMRHDRVQSLVTAWRILQNYPLTGGGLGTFKYMYNAYRLTPAASLTAGFNSYVYCAIEMGLVAVGMLLYLFLRLPLHVIRRWRLFPNRRLRFAVFVFLAFTIIFALQSFHDANLFTPGCWFVAWSAIGTLVGLVMVRDPVRIFEMPFPPARSDGDVPRRRFFAPLGSPFGRTPTSMLPSTRPGVLRRLRIGQAITPVVVAVLMFALTVVEAAPYYALRLTRLRAGEKENSKNYGERLAEAARIFPLSYETWSKIGQYYRSQADSPLDLYQYSDKVEKAYLKSIQKNRYNPLNYEMLYYLYRDTNNPQESLRIIKQGVQDNPNELVLRMLLVMELEKFGNFALATYHTKQALFRISPQNVELYLRLAEQYVVRGKATDAILYYQYAKQVVPDTPAANARLRTLRERLKLAS
ncbi:MAG: hypothetical protein ACR2IE_07620 [Candidatus Sumerlaeaceae bacterium]